MEMTLSQMRNVSLPQTTEAAPVRAGFDTVQGFELMQRTAKLFASSDIVPKQFSGNIANCVIAADMANRMQASPLMVMQNLFIVSGKPSWSSQFLIATFNKCGRFSSIRYEFVGEPGTDSWGCRAVTTETATKETLTGPTITMSMAKKEGWYSKNGSKWQTMPELMLRYRAASFLVRTVAPEIAMGLHTVEEVQDAVDMEKAVDGTYTVAELKEQDAQAETPTAQAEKPKESVKEAVKAPAGKTYKNEATRDADVQTWLNTK